MVPPTDPRGEAPSRGGVPEALARAAGGALLAVLAFGSRVTGAGPDPRSAWDLFVVVDSYRRFYERCAPAFGWRRSPRWMARLNGVLPPNVVHLTERAGPGAKLFVISERDLERKLDPAGDDHFCRARLMQRVVVVWSGTPAAEQRIEEALARNRRAQVEWMRPFLGSPFDGESFCRRLLRESYRTEIRPEGAGRADEVFAAQREDLMTLYVPVLEAARREGVLSTKADGVYFFSRAAGAAERWSARRRLQSSKMRTTARWMKHLLTFEGWLDYIAAKVERRTDVRLDLTERERRYPFVFLWPKFFRVLRARQQAEPRR